MDFQSYFTERLDTLKDEGNYRVFADLERRRGNFPNAQHTAQSGNRRDVTIWCSNDYLGMGQHPSVLIKAMHDALDSCGAGAGGTRNISGTTHAHVLLEARTCRPARQGQRRCSSPRAMSRTGPRSARWPRGIPGLRGVVRCAQPRLDDRGHPPLAGPESRIWKHNDLADLEAKLSGASRQRAPKLIAFESVYSMDGDIAPIAEICDLCDKYGAMTYLDEVHAVGLYGPSRRRHRRARGTDGPPDRDRGHAGQGVRRDGRLHRRLGRALRLRALASPRASSSPRPCRPRCASRCRRRDPPPQAQQRRTRRAGNRPAWPKCAPRLDTMPACRICPIPATSSR